MPTNPPFPPHKTQADSPAAPPAPFLFSEQAIAEITDEEKRHGRYTAARCPPELRRSIIALLKEGRSHREIERLLSSNGRGVSRDTVKAIHDVPEVAREVDEALQLGSLTGPKSRRAMHALLDRVIENPHMIPGASLSLAIKNMHEISQLEDGKPTSIEEHRPHMDIFASFQMLTAQLKATAAAEEIPPKTTGLDGEKPPPLNQRPGEPGQGPERDVKMEAQ
jgi:hypothetical protein